MKKIQSVVLVACVLAVQAAGARDLTWSGGTSTWGDATATGWNDVPPAPGDIARIYSGSVNCDHKDQLKTRYVYVGTNGAIVCTEMNYMGQPALLTFAGGGKLTLNRNARYNNYGAMLLPKEIWVTGKAATAPVIEAIGPAEHNFLNMPEVATFQVYDGQLLVSAPLADNSDMGEGTTWVASALVKDSPGTLVLAAVNTYSGPTTVKTGTLLVNGSIGAGAVTVAAGGILGGSGTIAGAVTADGTVSPGAAAVGKLTLQSTYTQNPPGTLAIEIAGPTSCNVLAVGGAAQLGGNLKVILNGYAPVAGDAFTILTASEVKGEFAAKNLPPLGAGLSWNVQAAANKVTLTVGAAAAP